MKARILNVIADLLPFGPGEQAAILAPNLLDSYEVDFFCCSCGNRGERDDALIGQWHEYEIGKRNWLGAARHLRDRLRRDRYELVHTWDRRSTELLRWTLLSTARSVRPRVWIEQLGDESSSTALRAFPGVPKPTTTFAETWLAATENRVATLAMPLAVPCPVQTNKVFRSTLKLSPEVKLIGAVCPLEARCGLKHLIWCLDQLKCVRDDIRLVIWGTGSQAKTLRRYARQVGVDEWVFWFDSNRDVRSEMSSLDLYWHAPRSDSTPAALATALLLGLPTIAPASAATRDLCSTWPTTLKTVPWGARDEISRQTHQWLEHGLPVADPAHAAAWCHSHSPSAVAQEYAKVYARLLRA